MIKLAIVSPCYNEEEVLEDSAARLTALVLPCSVFCFR